MKKSVHYVVLILMLFLFVGSLAGCRNSMSGDGSTQGGATETETQSEIVEATEIEIEDTEDTKELFFGCTVKDINLDFLVEDMEGYTIWANQVTLIEDRIYFTVLLYSEVEENPSLFRLVSCDLDGSNIQAVPLETPEIEKKGYNLYRMTVGQDGNVYALKLENDNGYKPHYGIGIPGFTEEYSLISWDSKGQIVFESQIKPIDGKYQHVAIENIYVSKEGKITMSGTCQEFTMGLIMQVGKDGSMLDILWIEPIISLMRDYRGYYDDGTVCTKQIEEDKWYYLIYDVNNQTLEKIEMPNEIQEYGFHDGANYKIAYFSKDGYLYRYEIGTDDIEQRMKVKGVTWLFEVLEIDENIFIMHYGDGQSYKVGIFTKDQSNVIEGDKYTLLVKGKDITYDNYLYFCENPKYVALPFTAVIEELGAVVEQKTDDIIHIIYQGETYVLDLNTVTLVKSGSNTNCIIPAPDSKVHYKRVEDELLIDHITFKTIAMMMDINIKIDVDYQDYSISIDYQP